MTKIQRLAEVARRRVRAGEEAEQGFTLIELLVVLLIIGILLAIAIPTFLSVTKTASDTAAQSNLQTALTGSKTWYTQHTQTYSGISLATVDVNISVVTGTTASSSANVVSLDQQDMAKVTGQSTGTAVSLASYSAGTHICWGIVDLTAAPATGTTFDGLSQAGTAYAASYQPTSGTCTGKLFATQPTPKSGAQGAGYSPTGFSAIASNENLP